MTIPSLNTQILKLSQSVDAAMVEVREEVGEIKCEMRSHSEHLTSLINPIQGAINSIIAKDIFYRRSPGFAQQVIDLSSQLDNVHQQELNLIDVGAQYKLAAEQKQQEQMSLFISLATSIVRSQATFISAII